MAAAFATSSDLAAAWRALTADEDLVADTNLAFASAIIRSEITDVDSRIAATTLDIELVKGVAVQMVRRAMLNPEGWRSEQESIEDYSTQRTRDSALSTGGIYLSEQECALLSRKRSGAFSITPSPEPTSCSIEEQIARNRAWRDRTEVCP